MAGSWTASIMRPVAFALALASLTTLSKADEAAADYYVRDLPGLPEDATPIKMHAGHIEVTPESNGNLFFWHFENKHIADRQRTVIWLNGGPGCSSEDGALMEIGPYRVQDEGKLALNNGSWNEFANLLFVDNPVGTGFSFVNTNDYVHELETMAEQFILFLEKFFDLFPQYAEDDIYIAGESYAGQHIPHVARAILDRNKNKQPWNLKGLLIGNGWISAKEQYEAYVKFGLEKGLIEKDSPTHKTLDELVHNCQELLSSDPGHVDYRQCEKILQEMLKLLKDGNGDDACINMYDVRLKDSYPSCGMNWPPDLKYVAPYLRRREVTEALHVKPARNTGWTECNGGVGSAFTAQNSKPSIELLPGIVEEVPILLFSGAEDLICNHIGTEDMLDNMEWNGAKGFEVTPGSWAPRRNWTFESEDAGFWQEARNLTYVLFYEASHMVPFDFPRRSRDMLDRFMGVDISSIGGTPSESRIGDDDGLETTIGGASNNTDTEEETQKQVDDAKWEAYRRSGEIVLIIVVIAAAGWGYFIWRERRKQARYEALSGDESTSRVALGGARRKPQGGDLEAAAFDERELDDLHLESPTTDKYSVGDDSDDDAKSNEKQPKAGSGSNY